MLKKAGFIDFPGKGSHNHWLHPLYAGKITLSGKDGKKLKYRIVIQWSDEDNCYLVGLPDFPGQKWRTHGNTYAESVKNAEEVLESLMELYQKLGESLPEPEINKKREILQK